ncbi:MAG: hypothetical protein ACD_80C00118G0008 [uncultured bacterium (gcode 4)]|uniref:Uncharacterized protein n=1 Tax=uncultured bacterium (gcode 4) TaxID=1234023 RepID=K1YIC1_9BACT|nr:MAG: hypothetical protein ACD_80C00118G0008 [uncultured bacterium (gcode 4)]
MPKNKKKSPGRPKKEFISHKPKTKIKSWPGRPRKDQKYSTPTNQVSPAVVWFVAKSVDESKKKDLIILVLFFLSFILFVVSLYYTFIRDKKTENLSLSEISEIANIDTGNIDYTTSQQPETWNLFAEADLLPSTWSVQPTVAVESTVQNLTAEQQTIIDFYQAINAIDTTTVRAMADTHLKDWNVFQTYYSNNRLSKFSAIIVDPKIVVTNIQEEPTTSTNPNVKNFSYTLEYMLASNQQKITEERSTVLIKKGEDWKIGQLMCVTKGCSTMPFFNPDKYR